MIKLPQARLDVREAPRHVESIFEWALANLDRLAIGGLVAAGIVGVMLVMRWIGHRILEGDPEVLGWKGIIGRVFAKTTILFMVAAAIDIVASYAVIPAKLSHLADMFFTVAAAFQAAIWAREIIIGVIRGRVGEDALCGKADRDSADAKAGDQSGDVDAKIVEDDDDRDGEHRDADQHADQRHGIAQR